MTNISGRIRLGRLTIVKPLLPYGRIISKTSPS